MATEVELKLLLPDEIAHGVVRSALERLDPQSRCLEQVNYYFDTPRGDLRAAEVMVRRRVTADQSVVTVKAQPQLQAGLMRVTELERQHDPARAAAWLRNPPSRLQMADLQIADWLGQGGVLAGQLRQPLAADTWLHVLGAMATTRRVFRVQGAALGCPAAMLTVELDHARFAADGADSHRYEVEIEHPDAAALQDAIGDWLAGLGVAAVAADESKYAQMLRVMARPAAAAGGC